jgi:hypothetical protein
MHVYQTNNRANATSIWTTEVYQTDRPNASSTAPAKDSLGDQAQYNEDQLLRSTQSAQLERSHVGASDRSIQSSRTILGQTGIIDVGNVSVQPQSVNGTPDEISTTISDRKSSKLRNKRRSLFPISRLFGPETDQERPLSDTTFLEGVHFITPHRSVQNPSILNHYPKEKAQRPRGQVFDENSIPSREQVIAYIEGKLRRPSSPIFQPSKPSRLSTRHSPTVEDKPLVKQEAKYADGEIGNTAYVGQLHLKTMPMAKSFPLPVPMIRKPPERCPETYGWTDEHLVFGPSDEDLLVVCHVLGHGSLGIVEEVRRKDTQLPTFVRKHVPLSARKAQAKADLRIIQEEAKHLRSLVHPHIVNVIGSYEVQRQANRHSYFLLMSPVGDNDLRNFLDIAGDEVELRPHSDLSVKFSCWIMSWFLCLVSALDYMHQNGVRHQDIKPSNIIHKDGNIYFTDFSSSCDFQVGQTTSTENPSRSSPVYAAPEVLAKYTNGRAGRHGRASDVYGLGCVFCEMLNVWLGHSISNFHSYLSNADGTVHGPLRYSDKVSHMEKRFESSILFSECIRPMLSLERSARPTAAMTVDSILNVQDWCRFKCECIDSVPERTSVAERSKNEPSRDLEGYP